MVDPATADCVGADLIQHLCSLGGTSERVLLCAAVPVAVLLAVSGAELRAPDAAAVWLMVESIAGVSGSGHSARVPRDLLLLPQGVLPLVLLVPAGLLGAGCAPAVQR